MRKLIDVKYWREWTLGITALVALVVVYRFPAFAQDVKYHLFADTRAVSGIPNFWNVVSNLLFMVAGMYGFLRDAKAGVSNTGVAYRVFCTGAFLVGLGSAYYHLNPVRETLVWDRLPMTLAFMALFSLVIRDRVSRTAGDCLLWPLLLAGLFSAGYWHWTELHDAGDLRAYALVQFLPMLLIPMMLLMFRGGQMKAAWLWSTLGLYAVAKLAEHYDRQIFDSLAVISGHSIKHILGALAVLCVVLSFSRVVTGEKPVTG